MSPDGAFLWVPQANLSSAGHYSCVAANAVGEKTKHAQLTVLGECCASATTWVSTSNHCHYICYSKGDSKNSKEQPGVRSP